MTAPAMLSATLKMPQQQDYRQAAIYTDQHGREWSTEVDIKVKPMRPCVALTPAGWRAPFPALYPPQKYFTFPAGRMGVTLIDYDAWLIDAAEANREYDTHVIERAKHLYGGAALAAIKNRDADLLRITGPSPAAMDFIRAMKAGNKWALGILKADGSRYPMPPWAEPIADTLKRIETYGGSDVELESGLDAYPDVEDDDALESAERLSAASQWQDLEDAIDPEAAHVPVKRGRGRPRKALTE